MNVAIRHNTWVLARDTLHLHGFPVCFQDLVKLLVWLLNSVTEFMVSERMPRLICSVYELWCWEESLHCSLISGAGHVDADPPLHYHQFGYPFSKKYTLPQYFTEQSYNPSIPYSLSIRTSASILCSTNSKINSSIITAEQKMYVTPRDMPTTSVIP